MSTTKAVLAVRGLSFSYGKENVLQEVDFSLEPGHLYALAGPNGAGKSTLFKCVLGLQKPSDGEVLFFEKAYGQMRKRVAYVPQSDSIDLQFPIQVKDFVLMGRYVHTSFFLSYSKTDKAISQEAIEKVGLEGLEARHISQLSGGQFKRMLVARALAQEADLLMMDEPFAGVDVQSEGIITKVLKEQCAKGKTIFAIHHDLVSIKNQFDHVFLLNKNIRASGKCEEVLTDAIIENAYRVG